MGALMWKTFDQPANVDEKCAGVNVGLMIKRKINLFDIPLKFMLF